MCSKWGQFLKIGWKAGNEKMNRNGNKKHTNHWCNIFFMMCLVITLVLLYDRLCALPLLLYWSLWLLIFVCDCHSYGMQVTIQSGAHVRGSGHETSYNLTMRVTYFAALFLDSFDCVKQIMARTLWGIFIQNQLLTKYGTLKTTLLRNINMTQVNTLHGMPRNVNQQHLNDYKQLRGCVSISVSSFHFIFISC